MPAISVMTQIVGLPRPRYCGKTCTCNNPIAMPVTPTSDPTDRSMLRVMITSTIPVAMIPMVAV